MKSRLSALVPAPSTVLVVASMDWTEAQNARVRTPVCSWLHGRLRPAGRFGFVLDYTACSARVT